MRHPLLLLWLLLALEGQAEPLTGQVSGYHLLGEELQALQDDAFANPGMLWVDRGQRAWNSPAGARGTSCRDCHGGPERMQGLAAQLPRWNAEDKRLENLEGLVRNCRSVRQRADPPAYESDELLALTTLIAYQSRGLPLTVAVDGPAADAFAAGRDAFARRRGQLDLSCADCHDRHAGARLRGETISAGMINGFPLYRLTWEGMGSRQRMIRWCNEAVRAEPLQPDTAKALALELFLAWRSRGLELESPAIRR
ncbi:MAG: sulfur oxidation c-type cytochrome SoxA [Gammaproteobacteria bacterium]|nr:MAG: sulfur oxidation c-type cytochrome SoxA [Gammaproteobacteria bacterium]